MLITGIGEGAFHMCGNMTEISLPEGVKSIGDGAFSACSSDRGEAAAFQERIFANAFHALRQGNGCQTAASVTAGQRPKRKVIVLLSDTGYNGGKEG